MPMRLATMSLLLLFLAVIADRANAQTATTTHGAPAGKTSVEFNLNTAAGNVTKVEVEKEDGGWKDITSECDVDGEASSTPEVIRCTGGNFPTGKKVRITIDNWATVQGQTWGTKSCTLPPV